MSGGEGHGEILSELTAGLPLPHVMAARVRHACGTLTMTGSRLARTRKFVPIRPLVKVEHAFAELGRYRRLARSYEGCQPSALAWV